MTVMYIYTRGAENMALLDNSTKNTPFLSHDVEKGADPQEQDLPPRTGISYTRSIIIIVILFYMNLVTIMATSIGTAILPYLQASFKIDDSGTGLINISSYVLFALLYGFLGDCCNRTCIMCVGMAIRSVIEFCSSFPPNVIPPSLGILGVLLIIAFVKEPSRGAAEGNNSKSFSLRRWISDVKQISKNRSFIFSTLGTKTVNFTAGAISFWAPEFLLRARNILQENAPCQTDVCNYNDSYNMIFGILTVVAGIIGVVAGVEIAKRYKKYNPRADPIVCGFSLLGSAILLFLAIYLANITLVATYVLIFIRHILLMMNFSISADICLYVVSPARRTTAQAMSIILSNLLGDTISPLIIGEISNLTNRQNPDSARLSFHSLQYALWACPFVVTLGGGFFLISSCFIENDCEKAELEDEGCILRRAFEEKLIDKKEMLFMKPKSPQIATFYSLPKLHKGYPPVRGHPIVSGIDSLTQNVSTYIDTVLRSFVLTLPSYVRDTMDVLRRLEDVQLEDGVLLIILDVEVLYSSISHEYGCEAVEYFLKMKGTHMWKHNKFVMELLRFVLSRNYFLFAGRVFHQLRGTAMGSLCAPTYANMFQALLTPIVSS
ncbi:protein spinster homolog 1-like [Anomaloglossus baeobatrachus]|uniref:protein spinster homolog 1-like n=1 Tax=Anomaloglossus baeobatrachus TaxID=238106 RepID=UPI003F501EEF